MARIERPIRFAMLAAALAAGCGTVAQAAGIGEPLDGQAQGARPVVDLATLGPDTIVFVSGKMADEAAAIAAARRFSIPANGYALARIGDRQVAIDGAGAVYDVTGAISGMSGSSLGQRPPQ